MSRPISQRDAEIIQMAQTPDDYGHYISLQTIGDIYGVSRQRIEQILRKHGVSKPRASVQLPICVEPGCVNEVKAYRGRNGRYCVDHLHKGKWARRDTKPCSQCGMLITRTHAEMNRDISEHGEQWRTHPTKSHPQRLWFCDKVCQGQYAGAHYGFGPQRARKRAQDNQTA